MPKKLPIIWSPLAETSYSKIIHYITQEWSLTVAIEFDDITEQLIQNLSTQHKLCPKSKNIGMRRCTVTPQTSLLYSIEKDHIGLVDFILNASSHSF